MDRITAIRLLGIEDEDGPKEIKKKYRAIIAQVHPDAGAEEKFEFTAQEINAAYAFLMKDGTDGAMSDPERKQKKKQENKGYWSSPVNPLVYCERDIFEHVEDDECQVIGTINIARGKYLYSQDEEFSLFLKSIYNCSQEILEREDAKRSCALSPDKKMKFQAELAYLLAAQFINPSALLTQLARVSKDGRIYSVQGMLEKSDWEVIEPGVYLYPLKMKNHRLYLCDADKNERGYLSFPDDRLYYSLIPLFEQQRVMVKIVTEGEAARGRKIYNRLKVTVKFTEDFSALPENLNLRIEKLLKKYREE